ncbi:hypothetical protein [Ruminococcus albus]|uniref:SH3b domain-containing protein n=1 Tax=Ruminococcus albus TaxID=1264 RepID=A0A1H7LGK8_RUMAL|nr:hypothetical protein [Ruminococcus albus]SEK98026.1 hypothetical protein SAMN05216469_10918 [Ruminococcus albus]
MAKKNRFPLKLNETDVYNIEELRDNFDIDAIIEYYKSGQLLTWLKDRYYYDEADIIESLSAYDGQLQNKIAQALGAENESNNAVIEQNKVSLPQSVNSVILPSDSDNNSSDKKTDKEMAVKSVPKSEVSNSLSTDSNNLNDDINDQSQNTGSNKNQINSISSSIPVVSNRNDFDNNDDKSSEHNQIPSDTMSAREVALENKTYENRSFSSNTSDLDHIADSINSTSDSSNVVSQIIVNDDNNISETQNIIHPSYVSNSSINNSESIHTNTTTLKPEPTISNSVEQSIDHQNHMPVQPQIMLPTTTTESDAPSRTIIGKIGLVVRILFLLFFLFMTLVSFTEGPVCGLIALLGSFIMCPFGIKKVRDKVPVWVQIILSFILIIVSISMYSDNSDKSSENSDLKADDSTVQSTVEATETNTVLSNNEVITETTTKAVTTTETTTTTTPTTTEATTTTTAKPADAVENDYDVFETSLFVHVDEADTLPLRDKPNRDTSSIILRIPDKTRVDVLGYKDTGSEIWFRLDYEGTKGWARGGMLQPKNLNDIWNEEYDLPGMDKWRSKFILDEEYKMNSREVYANFQGTLYFQPDLSSGVQKRFKSSVFVRVYGVSYDSSEWYYVGTGDSALESEGFGWVHSSQLSW